MTKFDAKASALKNIRQKIKIPEKVKSSPWTGRILKGLLLLGALILLSGLGTIWYINTHKEKILAQVTAKLNGNIDGKLTIGSMEPTFLHDFPQVSLRLKDVLLRDKKFDSHHRTFLQAQDFEISLNTIAFFRGAVEITRLSISNAAIDIFTDASGYSNADIFKKSGDAEKGKGEFPELRGFELDNVAVTIDNQSRFKLFKFDVASLKGNMAATDSGRTLDFGLTAKARSLAFSTKKGSFIMDKNLEGDFKIDISDAGAIKIHPVKLAIGEEDFVISAEFNPTDKATLYAIHIKNENIQWKNASHLLSKNITSRLDMFDFKDPIAVTCDISGDFNEQGDPLIIVKTKVKNNELSTLGGPVSNCSFNGEFTNNYIKSRGCNDANSGVLFSNFEGTYATIPFKMPEAAVLNFEKPMAKGIFRSVFPLSHLAGLVDPALIRFTAGTANVAVNFTADIENFLLTRPIVEGKIAVRDGNLSYSPRKLKFEKTQMLLDFKDNDLFVRNIHVQNGRSILLMQGYVRNFLNLYYKDPDKIVLNWSITSPEIRLAEFLQFLGQRQETAMRVQPRKHADFTQDLNLLFKRMSVAMNIGIKKLYYNKFLANDVRAEVSLNENGIRISNGRLNNSGGSIRFNGNAAPRGTFNNFTFNGAVKNVDIQNFFDSFDNFGLKSMNASNLTGQLSTNVNLSGRIGGDGKMLPKSMNGKVEFSLENGALVNFDPIRKIGKYAFPLRDMNNIRFQELKGVFDIEGDKVAISPMQINSSVLNMDVDGIYSFGKGTNINVSVPLRDPQRDKDITDAEMLKKRRERGVVIRLLAADGDDGKVKISLASKKSQMKAREEQ